MQHLWWLVAIFASFVFAMYIFANQIFKLKGSLVMIYRGIGAAVLLTPFIPLVAGVENASFYYLCILQGFLIAYLDNRLFNAANRFGAELTGVIQPISVLFGFVMWFFIVPQQFVDLYQNPFRLFFTVLSICGIVASVLMLKKNKLSRKAFFYLLPALFTVTVLDLMGKTLMDIGKENVFGAIFYYSLITSAVAGVVNAIAFFRAGNSFYEVVKPRNVVFAGIPMVCLILSMYVFKNYSLFLAQNPAYVMAIIYAYPIWILLANNIYSRHFSNQDYAKPSKWVLASMVASIIVLILSV